MVKDHSDSEREKEETRCRHMGYSFRLAARVILYAPSNRQDSTYRGLCYTSRGALEREIAQWVDPMMDRSDNPSHHERTLLPRSYISLPPLKDAEFKSKVQKYLYGSWVWVWIPDLNLNQTFELCVHLSLAPN